jgi:hypothetical protein
MAIELGCELRVASCGFRVGGSIFPAEGQHLVQVFKSFFPWPTIVDIPHTANYSLPDKAFGLRYQSLPYDDV